MSDFDRLNSDLVLIVDDIPENLSVLHDALDESGYTVLVATNGETALQRARLLREQQRLRLVGDDRRRSAQPSRAIRPRSASIRSALPGRST